MPSKTVSRSTPGLPDAEKISVNLGFVDLGHIDLLVKEGFYANRTDFIRSAIRHQLQQHGDAMRQAVSRKTLTLGMQVFNRADLEAVVATGEMLQVRVLGLASIAADVSVELARAAIESMIVLGALHASPEIKAAMADRMR